MDSHLSHPTFPVVLIAVKIRRGTHPDDSNPSCRFVRALPTGETELRILWAQTPPRLPPLAARESPPCHPSGPGPVPWGSAGGKALRPGSSPAASSRPAQLNGPLEAPASVGHQAPLGRHGKGRLLTPGSCFIQGVTTEPEAQQRPRRLVPVRQPTSGAWVTRHFRARSPRK